MLSSNKIYSDMDEVCGICGQKINEHKELKSHIRKSHKLTLEKYYVEAFPRFDLYSGKPIVFKNKEQYFRDDFNNRECLKRWLIAQPSKVSKEYCIESLRNRINNKGLVYTPCELETKQIIMPPVSFFEKSYGDWYEVCEKLGLKNKFKRFNPMDRVKYPYIGEEIIIDTREQKPLILKNVESSRGTLAYGDYALKGLLGNTVIERKGLGDFISTLCMDNFDRFKREIERCKAAKSYMIVLIEEPYLRALYFDKIERIKRYVKVTPEYVFRNLRDLMQEYDNLQFLFTNGRVEASRMVKKLLFSGGYFNQFDLQLIYDSKNL